MYPLNSPPQETPQATSKAVTPPFSPLLTTPTPKTRIEQARDTAVTFIKAGLVISVGLIAFQWVSASWKLGDRLGKVNIEVWIGLVGAVATTYWTLYSEKEKSKLDLAQENTTINRGLVNTLESRIDSVLLQIAALKSAIAKCEQDIKRLDKDERDLDEKIDQYRYNVLQERLEILKSFYQEICDLHGSVAYLKGLKDGDRPVSVDKINKILTQVADQTKTLETGESEQVETK